MVMLDSGVLSDLLVAWILDNIFIEEADKARCPHRARGVN